MRNGRLKSRMEFSRRRKTAYFVSGFKDQHTLAMLSQVGGAHQRIVPSTDDDRIVAIRTHKTLLYCNNPDCQSSPSSQANLRPYTLKVQWRRGDRAI
jgi:hypothetical protein